MLIYNIQLIHETEDAVLIEFLYGDTPELNYNRFWVPLSVINSGEPIEWIDESDNEEYEVLVADIEVADWWINKSEFGQEFREASENSLES